LALDRCECPLQREILRLAHQAAFIEVLFPNKLLLDQRQLSLCTFEARLLAVHFFAKRCDRLLVYRQLPPQLLPPGSEHEALRFEVDLAVGIAAGADIRRKLELVAPLGLRDQASCRSAQLDLA